jgi:hypothetical protein
MLSRRPALAALSVGCVMGLTLTTPGAQAAPLGNAGWPAGTAMPIRADAVPQRAGLQVVKELLRAWQISKGHGVTVALVSSGINAGLAGLGGRLTVGKSFGNISHESKAHATALAMGIAGSGPSSNNPFGSVGLAPEVKILDLGIRFRAANGVWQDDVALAIRYAVDHGAKVIYVDEVGYLETLVLDEAVAYAASKNAVVIGAEYGYGRSRNSLQFPTSSPGAFGAGTVIFPDLRAPRSRHGSPRNASILVGAPGNTIDTSGPTGGGYEIWDEVAAGAWITATVALIKSVYPNLPTALVEQALALSATNHPRGGYNTSVGFGYLNPSGALQEASKLRRLHMRAAVGPGVANPSARLASGPAPGAVNAVRHSVLKLAGFGGAVAVGLLLLLLALFLPRRRRIQAPPPAAGPPGSWPQGPPGFWPQDPAGPPRAAPGSWPPGPPGSWPQRPPGSPPPGPGSWPPDPPGTWQQGPAGSPPERPGSWPAGPWPSGWPNNETPPDEPPPWDAPG